MTASVPTRPPIEGTAAAGAGPHAPPSQGDTPPEPGGQRPRRRIVALDVVRGVAVVMLLITAHPGPRAALPGPLTHADWDGLTFADTFFSVFLFAIGAVMPFSRRAATFGRAARRVALLLAVGIVLESIKDLALDWRGGGVLQHIAIAYLLAWLVLRLPRRWWVPIAGGALAAVWIGHLLTAGPGEDPWSREWTFTHMVDGWVHGGFRTEGLLQSAVSAVNVIAGAVAGRLVLDHPDPRKVLAGASWRAVALVAAGLALAPWVPINKHLWTPSFAILTAGLCFAWFAAALLVVDVGGQARAARPLSIFGSNPLAVYLVFQVAASLLRRVQSAWLGPFDELLSPVALTLTLSVLWTVIGFVFCLVLWRRRIFFTI